MTGGVRVGRPAPAALVASYFLAALLAWVAATIALVAAAPQLAAAGVAAPEVLLAVHLVGLGFLPLAVTGALLHVLPTLLRNDASRVRAWTALPLLSAGPVLAFAIAHGHETLTWIAAAAETAGFVVVAWEIVTLVVRAPHDRMLLASRFGGLLSTFHAAAALAVGTALVDRGWKPLLGIPHDRAIGIHLNLALLGWLTLLIITIGRTLTPMLSLAPAAPRRRLLLEELVLTGGLWLLVAGLALGERLPMIVGALLVVGLSPSLPCRPRASGAGIGWTASKARSRTSSRGCSSSARLRSSGSGLLLGLDASPARLTAYVVALLVGWAAGVTLGHLGKLLSLSTWAWWPPGPRPKQAALYPRRVWLVEAIVFAVGIEALVNGVLSGSEPVTLLAAMLLVGAAGTGCVGAALTMVAGRRALRPRLSPARG